MADKCTIMRICSIIFPIKHHFNRNSVIHLTFVLKKYSFVICKVPWVLGISRFVYLICVLFALCWASFVLLKLNLPLLIFWFLNAYHYFLSTDIELLCVRVLTHANDEHTRSRPSPCPAAALPVRQDLEKYQQPFSCTSVVFV